MANLREIEVNIGQSRNVLTACSEAGATDKSYYRWRREYGAMKVDQAKGLKQLERETARLKRLVGEMQLEKAVLPDVARGNFRAKPASELSKVRSERSSARSKICT